MARLQRRMLSDPTEVREVPSGRFSLFDLGDTTAGYTVFEPGWRWSTSVKPIAGGEMCEFHHLGFTLSGRARVMMADGAEMQIEPEAFYEIPPGHDAWVVGDEPWISIDWGPARRTRVASDRRPGSCQPCCSPTSSTRPRPRSASVTWPGATCCALTTRSSAAFWSDTPVARSRLQETGSSSCSTVPSARCRRPPSSAKRWLARASQSVPASTPVRSRRNPGTSVASPSTSPPGSWRWPVRARSWYRGRRGTCWMDRRFASSIAVFTSSRASRNHVGSMPWIPSGVLGQASSTR